MRTTVGIACLLLVAPIAPQAWAQDASVPRALTLEAALQLALERNPRIAAARSTVQAAEGQKIDVSRRPNPALTIESESYPLFEPGRPSFGNNQELTIRFDQEFEMAGRRRLRTVAADAAIASVEALLLDERRLLALEVRRTYFAVVLAEADLDVSETVLTEIDQLIALNRARVDQGEISGIELRRLQVERLRFLDDVLAAQLAVRNTKSAMLALLAADDLAQDFSVTEPLAVPVAARPTPDPTALQVLAGSARPDLLAAREQVRQTDTETRLQRALRTPNITVGGGYKRDFGMDSFAIGVTLPLPVFNRNQGGVVRADAERRRAQSLANSAALRVRLDIQHALNAIETSRTRVDYIERDYLQNAEQMRDTVLASYRLGASDLIDALDAQRAFRDIRRTYNRALYEYRLSLFQLAAATGDPASTPEEN